MQTKKLLIGILLITLIATLIIGCGNNNPPEDYPPYNYDIDNQNNNITDQNDPNEIDNIELIDVSNHPLVGRWRRTEDDYGGEIQFNRDGTGYAEFDGEEFYQAEIQQSMWSAAEAEYGQIVFDFGDGISTAYFRMDDNNQFFVLGEHPQAGGVGYVRIN